MKIGHNPADPAVRRLTEAAAWQERLSELGLESSSEFEGWLNASPENERAWRQVGVPLALFADNATASGVIAARRDALARAHKQSRPKTPAWARIAASIALVGLFSLFYLAASWWNGRPDIYQTAHGERRVVQLADGSRLSLDAETLVRVRLEDDARKLELVRGQARFDVARDASRPFSVRAADRLVIATGTAFNIDLVGPRLLVTLIEGTVEVSKVDEGAKAGATPLSMRAGQQLAVAPSADPTLSEADLVSTTAWTGGQLVFSDEPLSSVVERVGRYSRFPLKVASDAAALRVSGVFQSDDAQGFVTSITSYLPVRAKRLPEGGVLLVKLDSEKIS